MRYIFLFVALCYSAAVAQPVLKVSEIAWQGLSADDRAVIQEKYLVEAVGATSFGIILDNQGADRSTPGTNGGAVLGETIASASYIDKAIGNGNYSAKNHLGVMLLGGLLGATLDSKPQSQYQFRYAIRLGTGGVIYQDTFSSEPFRHPVGVCVFLPAINIAPEQHLCTQTTESLRGAHIIQKMKSPAAPAQQRNTLVSIDDSINSELGKSTGLVESIHCKVSTLAPEKTSPEKCKIINGVILND